MFSEIMKEEKNILACENSRLTSGGFQNCRARYAVAIRCYRCSDCFKQNAEKLPLEKPNSAP